MERTLIAWNLPNMVTIPLMAAVGFLIAGVLWQLARNVTGMAPAGSASVAATAEDF